MEASRIESASTPALNLSWQMSRRLSSESFFLFAIERIARICAVVAGRGPDVARGVVDDAVSGWAGGFVEVSAFGAVMGSMLFIFLSMLLFFRYRGWL